MEKQGQKIQTVGGSETHTTTDHRIIREWIEARGGSPASVKSMSRTDDPGLLRVEFHGYRGNEWLEPVSWEAFFRAFDDSEQVFLYQDEASDGTVSHFCKFVSRN